MHTQRRQAKIFLEGRDQLDCIHVGGKDSPKEREMYFDFKKGRDMEERKVDFLQQMWGSFGRLIYTRKKKKKKKRERDRIFLNCLHEGGFLKGLHRRDSHIIFKRRRKTGIYDFFFRISEEEP